MGRTRDAEAELNLPPGFRFHPTDEELVAHYLCRKVARQCLPVSIIAEIDLYKYDPWKLPEMALFGNREWYFFTPRDRKYPNGSRPNRAAGGGYWKATGADKPITPAGSARPLGIKKALVFYNGKAPRGVKTDWIMHEYRLVAGTNRAAGKKPGDGSLRLDDWVLCRLYNKKNSWEKMQRQREAATSLKGAADSFESTEDTSGSLRTAESDVEDGMFAEHRRPQICAPRGDGAVPAAVQAVERVKEEDDSWFMDLNLDDLQSSLMPFAGALPTGQDYYMFGLASPQVTPAHGNFTAF